LAVTAGGENLLRHTETHWRKMELLRDFIAPEGFRLSSSVTFAEVIEAARAAGHEHVGLDGTLIPIDKAHIEGPATGIDLWCRASTPATAATSR
jgi:hypothetical protein